METAYDGIGAQILCAYRSLELWLLEMIPHIPVKRIYTLDTDSQASKSIFKDISKSWWW